MRKIDSMKSSECECNTCQQMCHRPCWGTPKDIKKMIDAGFAKRLMQDHYTKNSRIIPVLCPSLKSYEGKNAPYWPQTEEGCTFWKNKKCTLHYSGMKPTEGKLATCHGSIDLEDMISIHSEIGEEWDTEIGKKVFKYWEKVMSEEENYSITLLYPTVESGPLWHWSRLLCL